MINLIIKLNNIQGKNYVIILEKLKDVENLKKNYFTTHIKCIKLLKNFTYIPFNIVSSENQVNIFRKNYFIFWWKCKQKILYTLFQLNYVWLQYFFYFCRNKIFINFLLVNLLNYYFQQKHFFMKDNERLV